MVVRVLQQIRVFPSIIWSSPENLLKIVTRCSMRRNSLLLASRAPSDALIVVRGLIASPEGRFRGISMGLNYLKSNAKRLGKECAFDHLANLLVKEVNHVTEERWKADHSNRTHLGLCRSAMDILDSYLDKQKRYGASYTEDRCRSLFHLAEIQRASGKLRESIKLFAECELLLASITLSSSSNPIVNLPTLQVIQTSLGDGLIRIGELEHGASKVRQVVTFFKEKLEGTNLCDTEWTCFSYALLLCIKAYRRQGKLVEVEIVSDINEVIQSRCPCVVKIIPILGAIKEELSGYRQNTNASYCSNITRGISSPRDSALMMTSRSSFRNFSCESKVLVIDGPGKRNFATQTLVKRSRSSPAAPSREWRSCISRSCGKVYFYNTKTGKSTWDHPPHDNVLL